MNSDEISRVTVTALSITPTFGSAKLIATADVAISIDGVEFIIHGVHVRADGFGTRVGLPRYRDASGEWLSAITLPDEIRAPMGDAVMAAGIEAGILKER
jgi:stage V sporulation protein G